ncbi:MAG TPA: hypothetical protein VFE17_07725, partial [Candidatus Baltobacteraceae bacterium]|nr:hypothetical protein [Candidatus Baltobacteraceae bacterium]
MSTLWCVNGTAGAVVTTDAVHGAVRAPHPLAADPSLADPAWKKGAMAQDGTFQNLTTRSLARHHTAVFMLYDERNLYVAFTAEQAGTPIVATQTTNDVGFGVDDFVGVGIDTSGVGSQAYYFETTPRGVRYQQANENSRYKPAWSAAAAVHGSAWTAVMVIPLRALRIHPGSPQTWRINFIRNIAASGEHYTWTYNGLMQDGAVGNGWPNFFDVRYFTSWGGVEVTNAMLAASRAKPHVEVFGLSSIGADRDIFQQANGTFQSERVRPGGIDLTYPVTPTTNFVGTLSPDFSNVEIDQQTIAPQEFRRQLVEYRPFFAQGAAFINADAAAIGPDLVFYSPDIGPFNRGEKLEGTFGKQSFGVLNFHGFDQTTGNTFDDTAYGFKHALQNRTFLYWGDGVIAHHSVFGDDTTNEFGVAGRNLKTGFVWAIDQAWEHGSWVPQGSAYNTNGWVDVHKPNFEVNLAYQTLSPNYNP